MIRAGSTSSSHCFAGFRTVACAVSAIALLVVAATLLRPTPLLAICVDYSQYLREVGHFDTSGNALDVEAAGDLAYIAASGSGLEILDISDPTAPVLVSALAPTAGSVKLVSVSGPRAVITDGNLLRVIDLSNPAAPQGLGSLAIGDLRGLKFSGDYAYAVDHAGLRIIDVHDPQSPVLVGAVATSDSACAVDVAGSYAYVGGRNIGLQVIDISDPTHPSLAGIGQLAGEILAVAASGNLVYVCDNGLQIVNVSRPQAPAVVGTLPGICAFDLEVEGSLAYVADCFSLVTVDVSVPIAPRSLGTAAVRRPTEAVAHSGSRVLIADREAGIRIMDAANPGSLAKVCVENLVGGENGVAVAGSYAYVAADAGLEVVDLRDPHNPVFTGRVDTPGSGRSVAVRGQYAYVGDNWYGLYVVDVSDPWSPRIVGPSGCVSSSWDVALSGDYAYLADGNLGLQVVNISDPGAPRWAGQAPASGDARGVAVREPYAYLATRAGGLQIIDIANPAAPAVVATVSTSDAVDVVLSGSFAFVADGEGGLKVVDISDPLNPRVVGSVETVNLAWRIAMDGHYLYVLDVYGAVANVIDVALPTAPRRIGMWGRSSDDRDIAVGDGLVCIANGSYGLIAIPTQCTGQTSVAVEPGSARPVLAGITPNPGRDGSVIHLEIAESGPVRVDVFDVSGRTVRTIADGAMQPGAQEIRWDGRDAGGHRLPGGVYFVRVVSRGRSMSGKLLLEP